LAAYRRHAEEGGVALSERLRADLRKIREAAPDYVNRIEHTPRFQPNAASHSSRKNLHKNAVALDASCKNTHDASSSTNAQNTAGEPIDRQLNDCLRKQEGMTAADQFNCIGEAMAASHTTVALLLAVSGKAANGAQPSATGVAISTSIAPSPYCAVPARICPPP
jgi:hypothetical protein